MHKRKIAALTLMAMILNFSASTVTVLANEVGQMKTLQSISKESAQSNQAKVSKFTLLNSTYLEEYNKAFKLDKSKIISITNNGGHYPASQLYKAIDDNFSTHWETGNRNTDSFINEVTLKLDEITSLDRIVYGARQDVAKGKGFAQEFEIYSSLTDNGEDFKLVSQGKYTGSTGDIVEIKFEETEFKRLKFKFKKANQNWTSASEFMLYKKDRLSETIDNIFTDGTMTKLKDEYNNIKAINDLEKEVNNHPLKDQLIYAIDLAKEILQGDKDYSERTFTLTQYGDTHAKAKNQLRMSTFGTDLQSTGIVAKPGEVFKVYVEAEDGSPLPTIAFTQQEGRYGYWKKEYQLKKGVNTITVPEIYDTSWANKSTKGGAVYLINKYTADEQGKAPVVRIEGGEFFPLFNSGDDQEKFLELLKEYKKKLDEDPENTVDIYEFNTKRVMYTGTAKAAYQVFVNEGVDVEESVQVWNKNIQEAFDFAGLKDDPSDPNNDSTNVRTSIRLMQPFGAAYAYTDHIGVQRHIQEIILRPDQKSINSILWGTIHEVGHQMDIKAREWGEVTNNMWSNNAYIKNGAGDKVPYNQLYKYLAPEKSLKKYTELDYGERLGMFWQLQLKKSTYWAELESLYRERKPNPQGDQARQDLFAKYSSEVIGMNLTHYFEKYGFNLSDECKEELKKYPDLGEKIWYLNTSAMDYEGNGFENEDTSLEVSLSKSSSGIKLSMSIDKNLKEDLLGYEIIKEGKVIGFTSSSTFTDSQATDADKSIDYEVIPYAKDLSTGNRVQINSLKPSISVQQDTITLKLNEKFNAKEYVKGLTHSGSDITEKVEYESDVDTTNRGNYQVKYTVKDNGSTAQKIVKVEVVSDYDYLSDSAWKSATTVWGTPRRNSNIQGRVNGDIKKFEKGFGIHANGKITYDLSDKEYDTFEALLGVDTSIQANNNSSVRFNIIADGKTVASTNVLGYYDNMVYVNVPVSGVKELVIEVSDNGNGNTLDHCIIANPKLTTNNAKPSLTVEEFTMIKKNTNLDLMDGVVAEDKEDGDLTDQVIVDKGGFKPNKAGSYTVTYTVTDSDSNVATKERQIVVYGQSTYLSDLDWVSATTGWKTVVKDMAIGTNEKIKLNIDGKVQTFDKGISTATNSEIVYDLDGNYNYFTTYVGTDKNYNLGSTTIRFKVLADGKEVYTSDVIKTNTPAEFVKLDVTGVKQLVLVADDVDGNLVGDFSSWADSKLYQYYSKPVIKGDDVIAFNIKEKVDLLQGITAIDFEDGDITSDIKVETDYAEGKAGVFDVLYSVTDSDGFTTKFTRKVAITDEETYISDLKWKSATIGSGAIGINKSVRQEAIKIRNEDGSYQTYSKGIGTHAHSEIVYDSTGYDIFDTWVGLDGYVSKESVASVNFKVYVDGVLKAQTGIMKADTPKKHLVVDVRDSSQIKLVADQATNGNSWDHADWADAKFRNVPEFNTAQLEKVLEEAKKLDLNNYIEECIEALENAMQAGEKALTSQNQETVDSAVKQLREVINSLVEVNLNQVVEIPDAYLRKSIQKELNLSGQITVGDMRKLLSLKLSQVESLEGLQYAINLQSLNIEYNEIRDLSPLKNLRKLTDLRANPLGGLVSTRVYPQDKKATISFDVINRQGEKLAPTSITLKHNKTHEIKELNVADCVDENGLITIDTTDFEEYLYTVTLVYEDQMDNYSSQFMFMIDNRQSSN